MSPEKNVAETEAATQTVVRKTFRSPAFIEVYANTSGGAFTPWDIEITFGRLGFSDGEPAVEELAAILLSPHHAKAVAKVLAKAVQSWEERHGEIVLSATQQPAGVEVSPKLAPNRPANAAPKSA